MQLIGENDWGEAKTDFDAMRTPSGLRELAKTVDGIGPWLNQLYTRRDTDGQPVPTRLVEDAHRAGLIVHPYTFRLDSLPAGFETLDALLAFMIEELRIDGLFTDFPDQARHAAHSK